MSSYPTARYLNSRIVLAALVCLMGALWWAVRHIAEIVRSAEGRGGLFDVIFFIAFLILVWQMALSFLERPFTTTRRQQAALDAATVVINVPCYNEDPAALQECLASMFRQTRRLDAIHVVDDGSTIDYTEVTSWFGAEAAAHGVRAYWDRQPNAGKRHAQGSTIRAFPDADFYVTIDSDAILDPHAIEEGLKPFKNPRVQSVAGLVMLTNVKVNLLTWASELWFVVGQLIDRSAMSTMGGVLVNSGALALYRGDLLRKYLDGYLNETFFGREVVLSDDSMLTIYALMDGLAVQQPTSIAFTLMPERYDHHRRQYIRWMRGAFIRSWWRFKYLPLTSYAYWTHFLGWLQMLLASITFVVFFVYIPLTVSLAVLPYFLVVPLLVGFAQGLRYFAVRRSDLSGWQQLGIYALVPLTTLYSFFVLRFIRLYAIATCLQSGWGTRETVELSRQDAGAAEVLLSTASA